jgi:AAA ATPase-like protein
VDERRNPYSPGAGARPSELAGRSNEIEAFDVLRHRAAQGRPAQSTILFGLRGVGKTVLLNELADAARRDTWITAKVEADLSSTRAPFRNLIAQTLNSSLRQIQGTSGKSGLVRKALQTFKSFTVTVAPDGRLSVGITAEPQPGRADTGTLQTDLTDLAIDLGAAAAELGIGVALFIDEMQHLSKDELAAICQACHEASQRTLPFFVIGAGLPNLPGVLAEAKSYAERLFDYVKIDRLSDTDAMQALIVPSTLEGVAWDADAMQMVLSASKGYPYFIQQFGQTTWSAAASSPITAYDAETGIAIGREKLDNGFFRARWERATPGQREYLAAMAIDGDGPSSSGEVARRLMKNASGLGPVRASLIAKGLVYAPEHGQIAFTVPGMAEFVAREDQRNN